MLDFLKGVGKAIAEPFDIIGRGAAEVLSGGARQKQYDAYLSTQRNATDSRLKAQKKLKEAKDEDEKKRLRRFIKSLDKDIDEATNNIKELQGEVEGNTDSRKFAAATADVGLTVASAGTYGAGAATAKTGAKLGAKEIAKNVAKEGAKKGLKRTLIKQVAPNAVEGAAAGALGALQQDEVDAGTIGVSSFLGGLFGGAIPAGQYAFGSRGKKAFVDPLARKADEAIDFAGVDKSVDDLVGSINPRKAAGEIAEEVPAERIGSTVDEFTESVRPPREVSISEKIIEPSAPTEGSARKLLQSKIKTTKQIEDATKKPIKEKFKENFFDKLSPINDLVKTVEKKSGKKIATSDNPYELGRLYAGMPAKVKQQVNQYAKIVGEVPDLEAYRELGLARRILGRPDIKGVISVEDANRVVSEIQEQFSPEDFARLTNAVDGTVEYNKALFRSLGDAGIFESGAIEDIIEKNPDYFTRFNVVSKLLKQAESGVDQLKPGKSFNLSRQNVMKALKGVDADEELLDPIESVIGSTDSIMRTIEKNNIFRATQKLADDSDIVIPLRNADDVAERISLSLDNKEFRKIAGKVDRAVKARGKSLRRLQSEVNNLNKKGLKESLKTAKGSTPEFSVKGLGGDVPTSKAANKLGKQDTAQFVRSLVEGDSKTLKAVRKKIANRDPKLTKLLDEIDGLKSEYDEIAGTIRNNSDDIADLSDLKVPDGYEKISGWRNGIREDIAIPTEVAQAYKGLNTAQLDQATNFVNKVNQVMKTSVTSLNVPFAVIRNPIRDFKTMAANSKSIPPQYRKIVKAWVKGAWEGYKGVTGTKGGSKMYDDWIASGGGGSGIYARLDSSQKIAGDIADTVKGPSLKNVKDIPKIIKKIAMTPVDAVQNAGAVLETAPRLAEFDAGIKAGKESAEAALDSRNVTVDFSQSGKVGQVLNAWVPFLNARMQGNKKLLEAAARDPKRFVKIYGMLTAAPIAATAAMNAQFPEVMDQIPGYQKDGNFVMVFGDEQDDNGNFTQVVKIPKSDLDKIFGNPLENFINYAQGKDANSVNQTLVSFASSVSPVDFEKGGEFNLSRTIGGATPVGLKVPLEFASNKNLYFDAPVVSDSLSRLPNEDQVREGTSQFSKVLAGATGQSPLKVENAIRGVSGSLTTDDPVSQLSNTVAGAKSNAPTSEFYDTFNRAEPLKNQASKRINEALAVNDIAAAQAIADSYNKKLAEIFTPWVRNYGQYGTADMQEQYDGLKINLSSRSIKQRRSNLSE